MVMTTIIMIIKKVIIKIIVVITLITITLAVIAIIKNSNNKGKSVKRWFANWINCFTYHYYYQNHLQLLYLTIL